MNDWMGCSEVVAGLLITRQISAASVRPEIFFGAYKDLVRDYLNGTIEIEDLISRHGLGTVNACLEAAKNVNGLGKANWVKILEDSFANYVAGEKLEKIGRMLMQGRSVDWSVVHNIASNAMQGKSGDFVPLSMVEGGSIQFLETGWPVFDEHIGGIPKVGLVIVGGNPGVGKTTFMTKLSAKFAERHEKPVAVFSIEMILEEIAERFRNANSRLPKKVEDLILLNESPVTPEEAVNKAATIDGLGMVCIDFADLMVRGENSESSMAHIYRTLMIGSKMLGCPIVLLSQLSRYEGGIPRPFHLRYTGLAEALAWMILMLYDPARDWHTGDGTDNLLPVADERAYIIVWKVRGGFRAHIDDSPGAIQIPFRPDKGWGERKGVWFSLKKI
ncbi:MAG: DnaB-like helicase C-terminal domain-containing protein [Candidatus Methanomethylicaceae archaeon]